jgi:hypothetical protein
MDTTRPLGRRVVVHLVECPGKVDSGRARLAQHPVGCVESTDRSSAPSTTFVFVSAVCTHTSFPSGDTRSMCGLLRAGKATVLTSLRLSMSIFETVSASRSGV